MRVIAGLYTTVVCQLVDKDGKEVPKGTTLTDFRGTPCVLVGGWSPKHPASTGRVMLQYGEGPGGTRECFPSVVDLEWRTV